MIQRKREASSTRTRARSAVGPAAVLLLTATVFVSACAQTETDAQGPTQPETPPQSAIRIPAQGTPETLDLATWNLRYFGAPNQGPEDDSLQMARVLAVIRGTDADLWGVQEVTRADAFAALLAELPGYRGFLANDTSVTGGSDSYHSGELKVGLIYKPSVAEVSGARIVLSELDHEFAGRPPMEVRLRVTLAGASHDVVVIVLHAKATADEASWERRKAAGEGLKAYLDDAWPDRAVLVPGDWNDDVDESITSGRDTPYRILVEAPEWVFPTARLSAEGARSMPRYTEVIDHILASDEAMAWYEEDSATVFGIDDLIPDYLNTTSDHLPVIVRFAPRG